MTHIDPFAPGDSEQHPANWGKAQRVEVAVRSVEDEQADLYQWRRDHFAMVTESDVDIAPEELAERHERYQLYFADHATEAEREEGAEFVSFSVLLRRAAVHEIEAFEGEWSDLFERHATDAERDPMWVEGFLPDLVELRNREAAAGHPDKAAADVTQAGTPVPEVLLTVPKGNALKEDWVEYALAVSRARGEELTFEQADAMTTADLKAKYKPQAD